jgi:hypothetical protein
MGFADRMGFKKDKAHKSLVLFATDKPPEVFQGESEAWAGTPCLRKAISLGESIWPI